MITTSDIQEKLKELHLEDTEENRAIAIYAIILDRSEDKEDGE